MYDGNCMLVDKSHPLLDKGHLTYKEAKFCMYVCYYINTIYMQYGEYIAYSTSTCT